MDQLGIFSQVLANGLIGKTDFLTKRILKQLSKNEINEIIADIKYRIFELTILKLNNENEIQLSNNRINNMKKYVKILQKNIN